MNIVTFRISLRYTTDCGKKKITFYTKIYACTHPAKKKNLGRYTRKYSELLQYKNAGLGFFNISRQLL